jgi:predicted transcriptional regulator
LKGGFAVSVAEVLWEGTARTVREATDAWKTEEQGAARAWAMEQLLRNAMLMVTLAHDLLLHKWDDLFSGRIQNVGEMGERLEKTAATAIELAQDTRRLASISEEEGYAFEKIPDLLAAVERLSEMKERLVKHWPRFDPARLEQGLAQAARGEFVDPEEIYREFPELLQDKSRP